MMMLIIIIFDYDIIYLMVCIYTECDDMYLSNTTTTNTGVRTIRLRLVTTRVRTRLLLLTYCKTCGQRREAQKLSYRYEYNS